MTYSKNKKLNSVLSSIAEGLQEMGMEEVKRYMKWYPKETDYNIAQYGNLLVYYDQVRDLYKQSGYKVNNYTDGQLWEAYLRQIGWMARQLAK